MALGRGLGSLISKKPNPTIKKIEQKVEQDINEEDKILNVEIDKIEVNPYQPRKHFAEVELQELVDSIKEHGILQPLIVTKIKSGKFELIAGERRLRSAKLAGLKKVPVIVRNVKDQQKLELALIENVQRADLNPIEEAISYKKLIDEFNLTQDQVGKKIGKSRPSVTNIIRLLDLPEEIQKALSENKISQGHARAILRIDNPKDQIKFLEKILLHDLNVRETEKQSKKVKVKGHVRKTKVDPLVVDKKQALREALGTKIDIDSKNGKGRIIIHFFSSEELAEVVKKIIE